MKVKLWNLTKEREDILHQVYEKLRDPKILKGCLIKSTQNAIESLNTRIWKKIPKIFTVHLDSDLTDPPPPLEWTSIFSDFARTGIIF